MTPLSSQARQPEQVERVDFAVPGGGTIGPRFPSWQEAVDHARAAIERFEYPGQHLDEGTPGFHPRRHAQEGGTLVVYSRAFVHMRAVTTPVQDRPGGAAKPRRCDGVACTWEVFRDGTVEACPQARNHGPEVAAEELLELLARLVEDPAEIAGVLPGDRHGTHGTVPTWTARAIVTAFAEAGWSVVRETSKDGVIGWAAAVRYATAAARADRLTLRRKAGTGEASALVRDDAGAAGQSG